ncbi:trypsin-like peptidase domain-containing protein [Nonomuraea angiospora]|uniref:trypsin-like serine peptidase n=1 Tax=Nonomuraea angiospora TaxID=46172 RepID=UPI003450BF8F
MSSISLKGDTVPKVLVTTLTTLAGVALAVPATAGQQPPLTPVQDRTWDAASSPLMQPARAVRYWTATKQAQATATELPKSLKARAQGATGLPKSLEAQAQLRSVPDGKRITPGGDVNGYAPMPRPYTAATQSRVTGRLFYVNSSGVDDSCSASVVRSAVGLLIVTAAHCVYSVPLGASTGRWHTNFAFVPAYDGQASDVRGREPYGRWGARRAWKPDSYTGMSGGDWNSHYDIALIEVGTKNRTLQDAVGAFTPIRNQGGAYTVATTGYPGVSGRKPYDGEDQLWCLARTEPTGGIADTGTLFASRITATSAGGRMETHNCHLFKGHSGGPWLLRGTDDLIGVLSAGTEDGGADGYSVANAINAESYGAIIKQADPQGVYDALSISTSGPRRPVRRGRGTATVKATVTMRGLMGAAQVPVTFTLPAGTSLSSVNGASCKRSGRQATCTIASIHPGRPVQLAARVRVTRRANRHPRVTAHVDSSRLDTNQRDNTSTVALSTYRR